MEPQSSRSLPHDIFIGTRLKTGTAWMNRTFAKCAGIPVALDGLLKTETRLVVVDVLKVNGFYLVTSFN